MIIQFTVENFLSFKEPATLSLAASALKEKQTRSDEIVFELEGTNLSLLKSAVIYGANASGKSNLVKALDFFKWFVIKFLQRRAVRRKHTGGKFPSQPEDGTGAQLF